ncbi:heme NO-binding domain-containing protein [Crateriforma conspicua]|uniref:Heme NO binding protein n=1 Tax=Crateriforma conspicua TaxID=2527996 RepID=A0A5C6FIE6_9PLAN|nr:heme NO-binding domain-containing protein [Crateriforma conspicua]TWU62035.1 Heme NO binding protein [Crateriforma conspicua]
MKGIVFTELIEMVEDDLGIEIADRMISTSGTSNEGAYTAVGSYDHAELIQLVLALSDQTGVPVPELVQTFGRHLFKRFSQLYSQFFEHAQSAFDFLPLVETYIHVEVRKLYPDAELPTFDCGIHEGNLTMHYQSSRPFADLAEGLVRACVDHFGDEVMVVREDLGDGNGTEACFCLTPVDQHRHGEVQAYV